MITKKIISFIFLFTLHTLSFSQESKEKQLMAEIQVLDPDAIGDKEIKKINGIIAECKKMDYKDCLAFSYAVMANIYFRDNDKIKALAYINKIDDEKLIYSGTSSNILYYVKNTQSTIYQDAGKYMAALKKLDEMPQDIKDNPCINYRVQLKKGTVHDETKNAKEAFISFKEAYRLSKVCRSHPDYFPPNQRNRISETYAATPYLATAFLQINKLDSAKIYISEALKDIEVLRKTGSFN
ncbi:hypothetical protein ACM46_11135 [Chryseobacterium angstadtii]|uniref:Tetratricopeptide repeat protein n=1 Tax=Chryseobacterium angstadtii TaxID=558151 RepID=A0A0J7IEA5_9FLAO|nr:hypothetical protein [Chryseobacterium angstadtii]KMQ64778.1 hypothetical protein ACM46_11135 [Chryseobacterium angstadtii]